MTELHQWGRPADTPGDAPSEGVRPGSRFNPRAIIVGVIFVVIVGLAIWYLARPEPLLVQGEAQSTRIDMAARVSGRLTKIAVVRGQDVAAGATLLTIENRELLAELAEAEAAKRVADAELMRINVGTRSEVIAQRKAEIDRAGADVTLAQQTYDRTQQLVLKQFAPRSKLDLDTNALTAAKKRFEQTKLAYDDEASGFTAKEHRLH